MRTRKRWSVWYGLPAQSGWPFYFYLRREGHATRFRAHLDGTVDVACRNRVAEQLTLPLAS